MEVHGELGRGFLEAVYAEALSIEFRARDIPFAHEEKIIVRYKSQLLRATYKADFVVCDTILLELKATRAISEIDVAQTVNYLKATGLGHALILNFGEQSLKFQRVVLRHPS